MNQPSGNDDACSWPRPSSLALSFRARRCRRLWSGLRNRHQALPPPSARISPGIFFPKSATTRSTWIMPMPEVHSFASTPRCLEIAGWTTSGAGPCFGIVVRHTGASRELAHDGTAAAEERSVSEGHSPKSSRYAWENRPKCSKPQASAAPVTRPLSAGWRRSNVRARWSERH